jgi:hypoxanthine phosphoribosyltransferase
LTYELSSLNDIDKNTDLIILEDIIDSGLTIKTIVSDLKEKIGFSSVKVVSLLDKPSNRKVDFRPDLYGFIVPNEFLVGFGLDNNEIMRNLPYVGVLKKD